jgi:hypothetical protein
MPLLSSVSSFLVQYGKFFGMAGTIITILAVIIPGLSYTGKQDERYSVFNHYISELGEVGVSRRAWAFNAGLIVAGAALLPFLLGLGLILEGVWSKLGMLAGVWASASLLLVGVFPMNNLKPHSMAAMNYFRGGLVTILLFSIAIFIQPADRQVITPWANIFGMVSIAAYAAFLILIGRISTSGEEEKALDPLQVPQRPSFMILPAVEWAVFFSSILWFLGVALLIH